MPSRAGSVGSVAACSCDVSTCVGVRWTSRLVWVYVDWSIFAQKTSIFRLKREFFYLEAQRIDDNTGHTRRPRSTSDQLFPSLAWPDLALPRPELAEIGPNLHPAGGERRHVCESISFSSQTGPPDSQTDPQDPPRTPPGGFEKQIIFFS